MQPIAKQFAAPNQPDVNPRDARAVDELYHVLIGPQPENISKFRVIRSLPFGLSSF
jgi:hypothetical protein